MQTLITKAVVRVVLPALFLVVLSAPVRAQVLAHSGEVAGTVGYSHTSYDKPNGPTANHPFYDGSGGYNVTPYITVLGEYKYYSLGTVGVSSNHAQNYGGAVHFNFRPSGKVVPYGVVGGGGYRFTSSGGGLSITGTGYYVNFGGGVSYYLGKNWGVRPEFRYERQAFTYDTLDISANVVDASGSIFYQFGGTGKKKK